MAPNSLTILSQGSFCSRFQSSVASGQSIQQNNSNAQPAAKTLKAIQQQVYELMSFYPQNVSLSADLNKSSLDRALKKIYTFIEDLIVKFLLFFDSQYKSFENLSGVFSEKMNFFKPVLIHNNAGDACYLASTLNVLRAYFHVNRLPIPDVLKNYESAVIWAVKLLKTDERYRKYFKNLDDRPPLLSDYRPDQENITCVVPKIIFDAVFKGELAEYDILRRVPLQNIKLINPRSLLNFIEDIQQNKPSSFAYTENGQLTGHATAALSFIRSKEYDDFIKEYKEYLKHSKHWVDRRDFTKWLESKSLNNPGWLVGFDQASGKFYVLSVLEIIKNLDEAVAITPKSIHSGEANSLELTNFLEPQGYNPATEYYIKYDANEGEIYSS
jgi:hypothetical protein